ncbi:MAG: M6 family metalloprotease domain-containing protein [Candidatus Scalindua sp.]|nr:M6 family metalloprotease domain-containing protein [Candidatus Scalindua sp.]
MCVLINETRTFPQGDGPDVQLKVFGDEFYSRYESASGYTVVYDPDIEKYSYAILVKGHFASSGVPISKPAPDDIRRHIQEDKNVRNNKFDTRYDLMRPTSTPPPGVMGTMGRNNGLLTGRVVNKGRVKGLTIIINFKDVKSEVTAAQVESLMNDDNYNINGNYCSVKEYYQLMSNGKLEYTNKVVGPITLRKNRNHYISNKLMGEALSAAIDEFGIDLSEFDSKGHGVVDAINFLYAGSTVYEDWLWPHNHTIDLTYDGINTDLYTIQSLGRRLVDLKIGTICHETGHLLCRFPDLYDYGRRDGDSDPSEGMGKYCLMSSGNQLNRGRTPAPLCAYLRDLANWHDNQVVLNSSGEYEAKHGDYSTILRYETDDSNEYFLIENRSKTGLDIHSPSNGLAVYHCDTLGSNEWQGGTADKHYQCALIQADGSLDLEHNRNRGDSSDMFKEVDGLVLSYDTTPSSKAWDGTDSGMNIFDISEPGSVIKFKTGSPDVLLPVVVKESRPNLLIPDNNPVGIKDTFNINKSGNIKKISVNIDITHTYIGDLEVSLETPFTSGIVLFEGRGESNHDLVEVFSSAEHSALSTCNGKSMMGDWTITVKDNVARDAGRLNSWKIEIEYDEVDKVIKKELSPAMAIPDNDPRGIQSIISISEDGTAKDIKVSVEISHTFIGDLQVDLISPSNKTATLHKPREGGNKKNLKASYDNSTSALASLIAKEQQIKGDWILQVSDNADLDTGILQRWSLDLSF